MKFVINQSTIKSLEKLSEKSLLLTGMKLWAEFRKNVSQDTWTLARSIVEEKSGPQQVIVWTSMVQWVIQEFGRKPWKMPPLDALVWWAGRHWFHSGSRTAKFSSLDSNSKNSIFLLARSIARKWIKPRKVFSRTFNKHKNNLILFYSKQMKKWIM